MQIELLIFPLILAAAHYFGQRWDVTDRTVLMALRSFSAGVATAYIFVILLPELLRNSTPDNMLQLVFIPLLLGFTLFHFVLKQVSISFNGRKASLISDRLHLGILLIANFGTAFVAMEILQEDLLIGIVLVVAWVIHYLLTDIVAKDLKQESKFEQGIWNIAYLLAPIVAGIASVAGILIFSLREVIFAFTVGALIYISLNEEIPRDNKSRPVFFVLGVFVILLLIFAVLPTR